MRWSFVSAYKSLTSSNAFRRTRGSYGTEGINSEYQGRLYHCLKIACLAGVQMAGREIFKMSAIIVQSFHFRWYPNRPWKRKKNSIVRKFELFFYRRSSWNSYVYHQVPSQCRGVWFQLRLGQQESYYREYRAIRMRVCHPTCPQNFLHVPHTENKDCREIASYKNMMANLNSIRIEEQRVEESNIRWKKVLISYQISNHFAITTGPELVSDSCFLNFSWL